MKRRTRIVALLLVFVLVVSMIPTVSAKYFSDISSLGDEYIDAINYVSDNEIMNGTCSLYEFQFFF